jgi:tetratricopeptide (TPR) repeat protein
LQTQDAIVTHLARAMDLQLTKAEAARLKRTPAANPTAEDLVFQCVAGAMKGGYVGKDADAGYALCEQALAIDPNNAAALLESGTKFFMAAALGVTKDPKGDIRRADELASRGLALDPDSGWAHVLKGNILQIQGRTEEAVAEHELGIALDPSAVDGNANLGVDYLYLGRPDKSLENLDQAIRVSPYDPALLYWYGLKSWAYFGLKQYDQAIDWARRAIAINPNYIPYTHVVLVAALALTDHEAEAREALQRYLALPSSAPLKTIGAWKAWNKSKVSEQHSDPRFFEINERTYDGLRKAGMPEGDKATN